MSLLGSKVGEPSPQLRVSYSLSEPRHNALPEEEAEDEDPRMRNSQQRVQPPGEPAPSPALPAGAAPGERGSPRTVGNSLHSPAAATAQQALGAGAEPAGVSRTEEQAQPGSRTLADSANTAAAEHSEHGEQARIQLQQQQGHQVSIGFASTQGELSPERQHGTHSENDGAHEEKQNTAAQGAEQQLPAAAQPQPAAGQSAARALRSSTLSSSSSEDERHPGTARDNAQQPPSAAVSTGLHAQGGPTQRVEAAAGVPQQQEQHLQQQVLATSVSPSTEWPSPSPTREPQPAKPPQPAQQPRTATPTRPAAPGVPAPTPQKVGGGGPRWAVQSWWRVPCLIRCTRERSVRRVSEESE